MQPLTWLSGFLRRTVTICLFLSPSPLFILCMEGSLAQRHLPYSLEDLLRLCGASRHPPSRDWVALICLKPLRSPLMPCISCCAWRAKIYFSVILFIWFRRSPSPCYSGSGVRGGEEERLPVMPEVVRNSSPISFSTCPRTGPASKAAFFAFSLPH